MLDNAPDRTHDPQLRSWVESANGHADFPVQNLPFCVFQSAPNAERCVGTAIGDSILDLRACQADGLIDNPAVTADSLRSVMALPVDERGALRARLSEILSDGVHREAARGCLVPAASATLCLPVDIGDYTDFFASLSHAINVGQLFRPDKPLPPNYKYVPVGYHGRASSIGVSVARVKRPSGQSKPSSSDMPVFGPSAALDYELEMGFFIGCGNRVGETIPVDTARQHIFGLCLLNDWSARDIQSWEYPPLGPFLAKSFATTISPWIVTMEALAPYRVPAYARPEGDPAPLPYLNGAEEMSAGGIDVSLEVYLSSKSMRAGGLEPMRVSQSNLRNLYWTLGQLVTHHASNGCNLRTGDLLGSGTVSGHGPEERGCLLEMTRGGATPLQLPGGETRRFLEDGDEVILRGYCKKDGFATISFGECRGVVVA